MTRRGPQGRTLAAVNVLVTGGAGYIGGHVVRELRRAGRQVVVVDDLSTGRADRVAGVPLVQTDLATAESVDLLTDTIDRWEITAAVHLAARKKVAESVARPQWYHDQNVGGTQHLLQALTARGVRNVVFSSSAAVYGSPQTPVVDESCPTRPITPYGASKVLGEELLAEAAAQGVGSFSLRYFNVAGAGSWLLRDDEEANLVTTVLGRLARGCTPQIYGADYATPDGTCVRDLVDVRDVAAAHVAALRALEASDTAAAEVLNVGTGRGVSVRTVVEMLCSLDGHEEPVQVLPRREGDPAAVVAAVGRARERLSWEAAFSAEDAVRTAWEAARSTGHS